MKHSGPSPIQSFLRASMVTRIIVVTFAIYLIDNLFLNNFLTAKFLGLDHGLFTKHWRIWQLLTYGFTHQSIDHGIGHIAFNMYGLWLFGRPLENRNGPREFLAFYLFSVVVSALAWTLCQIAFGQSASGLIGASGGVTALTVLFALTFPHVRMRMLFIPIEFPVWMLGLFIVASDIQGAVAGGDNVAYSVHLAGAVIALVYFYSKFKFTGGYRQEQQSQPTRSKQRDRKQAFQNPPRHTCIVCDRTNLSDPDLEFRYCSKCEGTPCYCMEHLGEHEHKSATAEAS